VLLLNENEKHDHNFNLKNKFDLSLNLSLNQKLPAKSFGFKNRQQGHETAGYRR
jgi:hypothetical protein